MTGESLLKDAQVEQLRQQHYNATVVEMRTVHEDLKILRVQPDETPPGFQPGQYTVVGLGNWEPRVAGVDEEHLKESQLGKLLKRAYSFSCPMLDEQGELLPPERCPYLEFYIVLVRHNDDHPPGLTPRLFNLRESDRLFVGPKVTGHYTLSGIEPEHTLLFLATGTGEAPHNAMIAHLLDAGHRGQIVCVTCVRRQRDLGYSETHRRLESMFAHYHYLPLTTREPVNLDSSHPKYVGKRYVQDLVESGDLEKSTGVKLDPEHTHVFLCGNPAMIGAPPKGSDGKDRYPKPRGMVEALEGRGFRADEAGQPGNIHFEKYW